MINLLNILKRNKKIKSKKYTFRDIGAFWFDWDNRRIGGFSNHIFPIPNEGDILECPMESGRIGIFKIIKMDRMLDPTDQWFASLKDIGYID